MRKLKPQKVDTIEVARTSVPLYLDRDKLDFFATLGLEEVRDPTIEGLRKLVAIKMRDWKPETWEEFIAVRASSPKESCRNFVGSFEAQHVEIEFEFFRGEKAKKLDGAWVERRHRLDREKLLKRARRDGSYREGFKEALEEKTSRYWVPEGYVVLPYSDQAWAKLCEAAQQLSAVQARIHEAVNSEQFVKALASGQGFNLLLAKAKGKTNG